MKNIIKQLLNGIGLGIGFGMILFLYFISIQIWDYYKYHEISYPPEIEEPSVSERGDLVPDTTVTDEELMEILSGDWWGISWDPDDETLYSYRWNGRPNGEHDLYFDYLSRDPGTWYVRESGIWWIKRPYIYTKTEKTESTYRILYVSKDYLVYQAVIDGGRTIMNGRIFVKTRVQTLLETLETPVENKAVESNSQTNSIDKG